MWAGVQVRGWVRGKEQSKQFTGRRDSRRKGSGSSRSEMLPPGFCPLVWLTISDSSSPVLLTETSGSPTLNRINSLGCKGGNWIKSSLGWKGSLLRYWLHRCVHFVKIQGDALLWSVRFPEQSPHLNSKCYGLNVCIPPPPTHQIHMLESYSPM